MSVLGKEFKYWKVKVVVIVQKLSDIPYSYFSIISLLDKVKSSTPFNQASFSNFKR